MGESEIYGPEEIFGFIKIVKKKKSKIVFNSVNVDFIFKLWKN